MRPYFHDLLACRHFCFSLVTHDIQRRYRRSLLGMGWAVLQPLTLAATLTLIFRGAFAADDSGYFLHVLTGLCFWNYVSHVINAGCQSIRSSEHYILQHRLPLAVYPLRTTLVGAFHFAVALVPACAVSMLSRGVPGCEAAVMLLAASLLLLIFGWAMSTIFGIATIYFPDLQHLSPVTLNILFYATPIIWKPEMLRRRELGSLIDYNPLASFLECIRTPLTTAGSAGGYAMMVTVLFVSASLAMACWFLGRAERRLVLHL